MHQNYEEHDELEESDNIFCSYCKDLIEPEEVPKKIGKSFYHLFCYEQKNGRSELSF